MIELKILSPEGSLFTGDVDAVFLPGTLGEFEVLPHHASIVSSLNAGRIRWRVGGKEDGMDISSGFASFSRDHMTVCVEK